MTPGLALLSTLDQSIQDQAMEGLSPGLGVRRTEAPPGLPALAALVLVACGGAGEPGAEPPPPPAPVEVMSFNVLCSFCGGREYDPWGERVAYLADVLARHDPDLLGLQELSFPSDVEQLLPTGYRAIWFSDQDEDGQARDFPDSTVFYRASRFEEREHGFFWLSPTPDEPFSTGLAGPALPRVVVWVVLADLEHGGELTFATTHFDPNSPSQARSAPLFLERLEPLAAGRPLVVTGDFNSDPGTEAYRILVEGRGEGLALVDAWEEAAEREVVGREAGDPEYPAGERIDHVLYGGAGGAWETEAWRADLTRYGEERRLPSDHRALSARLVLQR